MIRKTVLMAAVVVALMLSAAAKAETLAQLLAGGSITSGDKIFYGFHDYVSHGTNVAPVLASDIFVTPTILGSEYGLFFASYAFKTFTGQSMDTHFDFYVKTASGKPWITDNTLTMTGAGTNNGSVTIIETAIDPNLPTNDPNASLAAKVNYVYFNANGVKQTYLIDHQVYNHTVAVAHISKDIALTGGNIQGSFASVSDFTQSFSQIIPLPTAAWAGLGLLGILGVRKARKA